MLRAARRTSFLTALSICPRTTCRARGHASDLRQPRLLIRQGKRAAGEPNSWRGRRSIGLFSLRPCLVALGSQ